MLGLGDLGLVWSNVDGAADVQLIDIDLASDRGLLTATVLSLFLDKRAQDDDVPPSGDATDRRGWWADEFSDVEGDKWGSWLWLLDRSKGTNDTLQKAKKYVADCLQWMVDDKVCSSVTTDVSFLDSPAGLLISGQVDRPGKDPVSFRYAHVWDHVTEGI